MVNYFSKLLGMYTVLSAGFILLNSSLAIAGSRDQAYRMFNRLTGIPPSKDVLDTMEALIDQGKDEEAAMIAVEHPYFYNLGLKNWISAWTNVDQNTRVPLNDFSATVIGAIRDDLSFDRILYDDIIYVGKAATGLTAYAANNNTHYQQLETLRTDLKANLEQRVQSTLNGLAETAGVLTTRGFGEAYFTAGTNRRAVRFTMINFMCMDMEQLSDTTRADFRVRQDVDRSPGGDSTVFRNKCAGCHAGMDALAGAFAYYDFNNAVTFNTGAVSPKFTQNSDVFPDGFVTKDNSWMNLWIEGPNKNIGWNGAASGSGAKAYGQMLSQTDAFPKCMAKQVYKKVCLHNPLDAEEQESMNELAAGFVEDGFSMKKLFAKTAVVCKGE